MTYGSDRLTRDERMNIYKLAGEGYTVPEITRQYNYERGPSRKIRIPTVEGVLAYPESTKLVAQFRTAWLKGLKHVPIVDKKVRLYDLERLRQRLMRLLDKFNPERPAEFGKFMIGTKWLLNVLEQARQEVEQRPAFSIGIGVNDKEDGSLSDLSDEELKEQRRELLKRAEKFIEQRIDEADSGAEGDEGADKNGSAQVLLAASEELRRDELPDGAPAVSDLRQEDALNQGLPAVRISNQ